MNQQIPNSRPEEIAYQRIRRALREQSEELNLSTLRLTRLPKEVSQLKNLKRLTVYGNRIEALPKEIGELTSLERLELSNNQLADLPEELLQLQNLRILSLYGNQIKSLPDWIGGLTKLEMLGLSRNSLHALPSSIIALQSLRAIFLRDNRFKVFPKEVCQLLGLRELRLSGNELTEIPREISNLTSLIVLRLENNQLSSLPTEINDLSNLKQLYVHNNERIGLGATILGATWEEVHSKKKKPADPRTILDFYTRTQKSGRPLNEVKLILVGRGQAGKTSLVRRLVYRKFNSREKETPGISITPWEHKCSGDNIRIHVWDFAGQEVTHSTHQFFFTDRSVYVLVLTGREDSQERDADYWMRIIRSFAGDSPVIVVLNKIRLHPFAIDENILREKYPSIQAFISTDCKANAGIGALKKAISNAIGRMDSVKILFPGEWFAIKEALANMDESYLSYSDYEDLCDSNGETDQQAQSRLAGHLHALGVALNYSDDARLRHTTVLNPRWLTNGIYEILRAKIKGRKAGEVHLEDLANILPKEKEEMRTYLVELMRRFELCFPLGDSNGRFLVPQRLDPHQPKLDETWQTDTDALRIRYEYPALPSGVIPRFIVRTYALSEGHPRWRQGVILEFEGASALVRGDTLRVDRVDVVVKGKTEAVQRLVAIIRENFDRIHSDLKELNPIEKIELSGQHDLFLEVSALVKTEISSPTASIPTQMGDVPVNKTQQLNRLTPEKARRSRPSPVRVFVSYSHTDETLKDAFGLHLDILRNEKLIQVWQDRRILPGQNWNEEIRRELDEAELVIFLVSTPFIASGYIQGVEVSRAMSRERAGKAVVVPVILKDCAWEKQKWKRNQALPKDGKPVSHWGRRDEAWHNVEQGLRRTITALRKKVFPTDADAATE